MCWNTWRNTAHHFPDKLAFSDEGRSFSFAQLLAAAKALGSALAAQTDRPNRPVVVLVDHRAANLAAFQGVLSAGDYYVPLDSQMPLPRLRGIVETLAPAALVYGQARERVTQALADLCPVLLLDEAAFTHSVDEARLQCRRDRVLDIDPVYAIFTSSSPARPRVFCSPTGASLTSSNGWPTPAALRSETFWQTKPRFTLISR